MAMIVSGASNQAGAALGAHAFGAIGPAGVVAVRQFVAAAVLLPIARPDVRRFTWRQWWPTLLLGLVFATMNLSLYTAIDRIGLGLAVTLEFLGPLAVALAGSRTRIDLLCAVGAGAGVYVLVQPGPSSDFLGVGLGLLAACCWASYIVLNRLVGARLPGLQAPAAATSVSALLYVPVAGGLVGTGRLDGAAVAFAVGAGLLSSVIPYAADLLILRHVPTHFFGLFMSIHPVLAAVAGLLLLGQVLGVEQWTGIAFVVLANAVAATQRRSAPPPAPAGRAVAARAAHRRRAGSSTMSTVAAQPCWSGAWDVATERTSNVVCGVARSASAIMRSCRASGMMRSRV
ncbi:membrane protein [Paractinoplanes abujensis]|nr:EamA family transporter [Actinoplanes abujensis]GID17102.1 membrane protein [Actinoplanes abujensis]